LSAILSKAGLKVTLGLYQQFNRYVVFNHMFKPRQYGYQYGVGGGGVVKQLDKIVAGYRRSRASLLPPRTSPRGPVHITPRMIAFFSGEIQIQRAFNNAQPTRQLGHRKPFIACGFKIGPGAVEYFLPTELLLSVSNRATF
jgi:hypothetical protein